MNLVSFANSCPKSCNLLKTFLFGEPYISNSQNGLKEARKVCTYMGLRKIIFYPAEALVMTGFGVILTAYRALVLVADMFKIFVGVKKKDYTIFKAQIANILDYSLLTSIYFLKTPLECSKLFLAAVTDPILHLKNPDEFPDDIQIEFYSLRISNYFRDGIRVRGLPSDNHYHYLIGNAGKDLNKVKAQISNPSLLLEYLKGCSTHLPGIRPNEISPNLFGALNDFIDGFVKRNPGIDFKR